jgi:23S rRNA (guanosine2251-2'-O)-methyltransferase
MIAVIAHNIRSTHNIGSIFRTCDGFGIAKLYLTGYTPAPAYSGDIRLPHLAQKLTNQIHKTALGAEKTVAFEYCNDVFRIIKSLKTEGYQIAALEQAQDSEQLNGFRPSKKIALILGEEVHGIEPDILKLADITLEIPMKGQKESFNVSVAAGIALYVLSLSG